jgi:hypothetical protein
MSDLAGRRRIAVSTSRRASAYDENRPAHLKSLARPHLHLFGAHPAAAGRRSLAGSSDARSADASLRNGRHARAQTGAGWEVAIDVQSLANDHRPIALRSARTAQARDLWMRARAGRVAVELRRRIALDGRCAARRPLLKRRHARPLRTREAARAQGTVVRAGVPRTDERDARRVYADRTMGTLGDARRAERRQWRARPAATGSLRLAEVPRDALRAR